MGCSTARNKDTYDNLRSIKREALEELVLSGLQHHLMEPALCEVFAEEYTCHLNQVRMEKNASIEAAKAELVQIDREQDKLEEKLANAKEELVLIHPNMGKIYRKQIANLAIALNDQNGRTEAAEILRGLIDRIVVTPDPDTGKPVVDLEGDLAGILCLGQTSKNAASVSEDGVSQLKLVAGARSLPFRTLVSVFVPIPG